MLLGCTGFRRRYDHAISRSLGRADFFLRPLKWEQRSVTRRDGNTERLEFVEVRDELYARDQHGGIIAVAYVHTRRFTRIVADDRHLEIWLLIELPGELFRVLSGLIRVFVGALLG